MRKLTVLFAFTLLSISGIFAQTETNGTVYIKHPAINVVNEFVKASVKGDSTKMASFLTDDFKSYNGTSIKPDDKGLDKKAFLQNQMLYFNQLDYYSITDFPGSYPDAIQYKKDNTKEEVWVQTWNMVKGVHKATGVKIDQAAHRLYTLTKDNKIKSIINYGNGSVIDEIMSSFGNRTNGKIYNHHDNINTVRKAMYAFENKDLDKCLSFYGKDATFQDINDSIGVSYTKQQIKPMWQDFLNKFEITSIEMVGYPDYLEYEMNEGREVLSWWKYHLVRKSDKKKIDMFFHFSNSFDAEGKIVGELVYYGAGLLTAK